MRRVDPENDTLKTLGAHFSAKEKLKEQKTIIFKTLAISKIVFQSLIAPVPRHIMNELEKIQNAFLWKNSSPKIKHETLCNDYKDGGLKNIDI